MRVVECAELLAADLFTHAEKTRQRLTFGDVQRHLAQLASHPPGCSCGRCTLVSRVNAQRVYAIASGWQRQVRATRVSSISITGDIYGHTSDDAARAAVDHLSGALGL